MQHIPQHFSRTFVDRLAQICPVAVSEAEHGQVLERGHAYVAPGGRQLSVKFRDGQLRVQITDDPPVNRHKPSVDYLFKSVAALAEPVRVSAALLTGMGNDGAEGMLALRSAGCHTIAQDEASSVVWGMPRRAAEIGAAKEVLPLSSIAWHLFRPFDAGMRRAG